MQHVQAAAARLAAHPLFSDRVRVERPAESQTDTVDPATGMPTKTPPVLVFEADCGFFAPNTTHGTDQDTSAVTDETRIDVLTPAAGHVLRSGDIATFVRWSDQPELEGHTGRVEIGPLLSHDVVVEFEVVYKPRGA